MDESQDGYYAGAAHPYAQENIECFDTGTHAEIEFQTVFPALTSGSPALAATMKLVDGHLELTCCDSYATNEGTFADIGMDNPAPSGWAVNDRGELILAFEYSAFGRSFQATATGSARRDRMTGCAEYRPLFVPVLAAQEPSAPTETAPRSLVASALRLPTAGRHANQRTARV